MATIGALSVQIAADSASFQREIRRVNESVTRAVESTDEFGEWFAELNDGEQVDVSATIGLLEESGPRLPFPYSSGVEGSKYRHMRELRVQSGGKPSQNDCQLMNPRSRAHPLALVNPLFASVH